MSGVERLLGWLRLANKPDRKQRFVVLCTGRTGSNFLCRMLNAQNDVICATELFNRQAAYFTNLDIEKHVNRTIQWRDKHPVKFLRRFWSYDTRGSSLGFKLFYNHNPKVVENVLSDPEVKKILLRRRNKIKRYVSQIVAEGTDCWIKYEDTPVEQVKVKVEPELLLETERIIDSGYDRMKKKLISTNQFFKEIYYEDLVGERKVETLKSISEFVGCRNVDTECWSKDATFKQNSDKLSDIIENYDQLKDALAGTELEPFLD